MLGVNAVATGNLLILRALTYPSGTACPRWQIGMAYTVPGRFTQPRPWIPRCPNNVSLSFPSATSRPYRGEIRMGVSGAWRMALWLSGRLAQWFSDCLGRTDQNACKRERQRIPTQFKYRRSFAPEQTVHRVPVGWVGGAPERTVHHVPVGCAGGCSVVRSWLHCRYGCYVERDHGRGGIALLFRVGDRQGKRAAHHGASARPAQCCAGQVNVVVSVQCTQSKSQASCTQSVHMGGDGRCGVWIWSVEGR